MIEPVESRVLTEMDAMDSIVLSTCDACCIIQLLCHMLSPPHFPLQLPAYEPSSLLDQGYMSDQVSGGLWFLCREYLQVVVHQVHCLCEDEVVDFAHQWPFRCTNWSRTLMALVDPILQVVESHQAIALHSAISGGILDCGPRVGSRRIISLCRSSTWHVSSECWPYLRNGHWTRIPMNLDDASGGDIEPQRYWLECELTQVGITHSQPQHTPPNGRGRFLLSTLRSPKWGLLLCHCIIVSYP